MRSRKRVVVRKQVSSPLRYEKCLEVWGNAKRLAQAGIEPSVGSRGDSYDNALAETINGLYKTELIHRRAPWKTKESVELATLEWVSWFNHHRLLEPIGYIPPAEAEAN
jgi:putative transposase